MERRKLLNYFRKNLYIHKNVLFDVVFRVLESLFEDGNERNVISMESSINI